MNIVQEAFKENEENKTQFKEYTEYFKRQLTLNAKDLKKARDITKAFFMTEKNKAKELIDVIKLERLHFNHAINELTKKTNNPDDIYGFYITKVNKEVANKKKELFDFFNQLFKAMKK